MIIDKKILILATFDKLIVKASKYKLRDKNIFDSYDYFLNNPRLLNNIDDLITTISIAYSWMPTMLDILDNDKESLQILVSDIKIFKTIDATNKLIEKEEEIKELLVRLSRATNNSIVGASKVLHLFYPINIPIFDSRVRKAWNSLFPASMKIPILSHKNQIDCYFQYWYAILYWKEKLKKPNVREIEKLLFDYGGYLNDTAKKKRKNGK